MERQKRSKYSEQVFHEACEWFVEFRDGDIDASARREFDLWVRHSPEHLAAYLEAAAIWSDGPQMDPQQQWSSAALIEAAVASPESTVSSLNAVTRASSDGPARRSRGWRWVAAAASVAALALIGAWLSWPEFFNSTTYVTQTGEQRSIILEDGSRVDLNSASRIRVYFSGKRRTVELLTGQGLFRVAKDTERPFVVVSDETRIRAVGTQFDVYRKLQGTIVTVVEGRVSIVTDPDHFPAATPQLDLPRGEPIKAETPSAARQSTERTPIFLSAGEQAVVEQGAVRNAEHPHIASATAWTQRKIVFEYASLSEVAEEFNRYNERKLVIDDAVLRDFHVSGVFSSVDPGALIRFLRDRPELHVEEGAAEVRISKNIS